MRVLRESPTSGCNVPMFICTLSDPLPVRLSLVSFHETSAGLFVFQDVSAEASKEGALHQGVVAKEDPHLADAMVSLLFVPSPLPVRLSLVSLHETSAGLFVF